MISREIGSWRYGEYRVRLTDCRRILMLRSRGKKIREIRRQELFRHGTIE